MLLKGSRSPSGTRIIGKLLSVSDNYPCMYSILYHLKLLCKSNLSE